MSQINALFKSIQRDDKKDILKFQIQGESPMEAKLMELAGEIVVFSLPELVSDTTAEFVSVQKDSKKIVVKLALKGGSKDSKLYDHAGKTVPLEIGPSQLTIDEYYDEEGEGIEYTRNPDGSVDVDPNQAAFEGMDNGTPF